jgi:hypothetical protein
MTGDDTVVLLQFNNASEAQNSYVLRLEVNNVD